jgi:hypothetical protein
LVLNQDAHARPLVTEALENRRISTTTGAEKVRMVRANDEVGYMTLPGSA